MKYRHALIHCHTMIYIRTFFGKIFTMAKTISAVYRKSSSIHIHAHTHPKFSQLYVYFSGWWWLKYRNWCMFMNYICIRGCFQDNAYIAYIQYFHLTQQMRYVYIFACLYDFVYAGVRIFWSVFQYIYFFVCVCFYVWVRQARHSTWK